MKKIGLEKVLIRKSLRQHYQNLDATFFFRHKKSVIFFLEQVFRTFYSASNAEKKILACFVALPNKEFPLVSYFQEQSFFVPVYPKCHKTLKEMLFIGAEDAFPSYDYENICYTYFEQNEDKFHFLKKKALVPDLFIIPGLSFDKNGYRLGQGGGFYDRYYEVHRQKYGLNPLSIGLCPDNFIVETLPTEDHDLQVDIIITEKRIIHVKMNS